LEAPGLRSVISKVTEQVRTGEKGVSPGRVAGKTDAEMQQTGQLRTYLLRDLIFKK